MNTLPATTAFVEASRARPLRAWSQAQQDEVRDLLHQLLRGWQAAWSLADAPGDALPLTVQVATRPPADEQAVQWRLDGRPNADLTQTALRALQSDLFGDTAHLTTVSGAQPVIAPEITQMAWNDWQQRIESALGAPLSAWPTDSAPAQAADSWSGALSVQFSWCGARCELMIPGPAVQKLVRPAAPRPVAAPQALTPLTHALHKQRLNVQARLCDVTLTLGELEHLSPGDVLLLAHRLDAPLQVLGPDEEALCTAWLGQQSGRIALELSPLAASA